MFKILVLEDDIRINKLFCSVLSKNNFSAISAFNGKEALDILDNQSVDLIITDVMMPEINGFKFVEIFRQSNTETPILMITAKDQFEDKRKAFNLQVDDYMVKPVDTNEMLLRIHALLRRAKIQNERKIFFENITIDYDTLTIFDGTHELFLPQKEFKLLFMLASYPNKIFTRQQLMDEIWGMDSNSDERTVDVHVNRLRDKLKPFSKIELITVRGLGYKVSKL